MITVSNIQSQQASPTLLYLVFSVIGPHSFATGECTCLATTSAADLNSGFPVACVASGDTTPYPLSSA